MPSEVYPNPTAVTSGEIWRNILTDLGDYPPNVDITTDDTIKHALDQALFRIDGGIYGDGTDGYVVFDGTTTILGLVPAASVYTLTRDIQCAGITVNTGVIINTAGFVIRNNGITNLVGTANINYNGLIGHNNAAAGAALAGGSLGGSTAGGAGNLNNAAAGATGPTSSIGGNGGAGGNSNNGSVTDGGAGATVTAPTANNGSFRTVTSGLVGSTFGGGAQTFLKGGAGGGGGAGDGTNLGGGGGSGGGIHVLATKIIQGSGTITANGGVGGAGASAGNTGGGGGGGGGGVYVISRSIQPRQVNNQASAYFVGGVTVVATAAGGLGGAAHGANGLAGANGNNGTVLLLPA